MIYSAEQVVDMSVMEFSSYINSENVNTVGAVARLLVMVKLDLEKALLGYRNNLLRKIADNEAITKEEIVEFTTQAISIGAMLRIIEEKRTLADFRMDALTPDCFKHKEEYIDAPIAELDPEKIGEVLASKGV